MINNFPTYTRELNSFERTIMAKTGWACRQNGTLKEMEEFDESFNHKSCDRLGIPRFVEQPIDFII